MKTWTLQDVAAHWDSEPEYDKINSKIDSYFRRFTDSTPLFQISDNARVLDVDCRTAKGTIFFKEKYPTASFQCMAMSPTFKERALKNLKENSTDAKVDVFDVMPMPFDDESFDAVLTYETLEHTPWPEKFIQELSRMLKPDGLFVLTTPNVLWEPVHWLSATLHLDHGEGPHRMVPRKEILAAFKKARLSVKTEKTFVLIPAGPKSLLALGKMIERMLPEFVMRLIALRRTFICTKDA